VSTHSDGWDGRLLGCLDCTGAALAVVKFYASPIATFMAGKSLWPAFPQRRIDSSAIAATATHIFVAFMAIGKSKAIIHNLIKSRK